jgi:hypothetical protein
METAKEWNPLQARLKAALSDKGRFAELRRLGTRFKDKGNAMGAAEIADLSLSLDLVALRRSRRKVGTRTQAILRGFGTERLKEKTSPERLGRILAEGGVLEAEGSRWLHDFQGRKTVAGHILMPLTRHQLVHLNECRKIPGRRGRGR